MSNSIFAALYGHYFEVEEGLFVGLEVVKYLNHLNQSKTTLGGDSDDIHAESFNLLHIKAVNDAATALVDRGNDVRGVRAA